MTEAEKIAYVKAISDETDETAISAFLSKAKSAILNEMYRVWSAWPENASVPARYEIAQCELAVRYLNRRGGEGETVHKENGVDRTYGSPDDADILRRITPIAEVPQ